MPSNYIYLGTEVRYKKLHKPNYVLVSIKSKVKKPMGVGVCTGQWIPVTKLRKPRSVVWHC